MNPPGAADLRVRTRAALLDALEALEEQRQAVIVIGAQALYFHAGDIEIAIPATRTSSIPSPGAGSIATASRST